MTWALRINRPTPSQNTRDGQHWARRHRDKGAWWWSIRAAEGFLDIPRATGRRRLTIERHGRKLLDMDNMAAGCKALVDVIKHRGLILDDNPAACELVFRQATPCLLAPFTLVTLEDIA